MFSFISGTEIIFVFFIVLLVFGADKIPEIARTAAKGMKYIRNATEEIKTEITKSADIDVKNTMKSIEKKITEETNEVKKDIDNVSNSIKR